MLPCYIQAAQQGPADQSSRSLLEVGSVRGGDAALSSWDVSQPRIGGCKAVFWLVAEGCILIGLRRGVTLCVGMLMCDCASQHCVLMCFVDNF